MIQMENMGEGRMRFATKAPSIVEIVLLDGKVFVHSEPLPVKSSATPTKPVAKAETTSPAAKSNEESLNDLEKELNNYMPKAK